jgi:tRNA pseudouridine13 synthase
LNTLPLNTLSKELDELRQFADSAVLPCAYPGLAGKGIYRQSEEDFVVSETGVEPSGEGEHLLLRLRKKGQNTRWVAKEIARQLHIPFRSVSYAGLKDRHAVTEQWFGVHLPGRTDAVAEGLSIEGVEIVRLGWHNKKLRQGQLSYNTFRIILRACSFSSAELLETRLQNIAECGVPNYFGPQRFGRSLSNLDISANDPDLAALPRERRSFVISALRSALFNGYLSARVADGSWAEALPGEITISDRPRGLAEHDLSVFTPARLATGLLWGGGAGFPANEVGEQERNYFGQFPAVCQLLEEAGAKSSRRVLKSRVANMQWQHQDAVLELGFSLSPGNFATALLRELGDFQDLGGIDA